MKKAELDLTVEGDIADFLGVKMGKVSASSQPHLIEDIIKELRLDSDKTAIKRTIGASSKPLLRNPKAESFNGHFDYCRVIGNSTIWRSAPELT
jgi:hypothetical protein